MRSIDFNRSCGENRGHQSVPSPWKRQYRKIFAARRDRDRTVIAAPSAVAAAPSTAIAPSAVRYVALGDSFTSGPLIPTQVDLNCRGPTATIRPWSPPRRLVLVHRCQLRRRDHRRHPQPGTGELVAPYRPRSTRSPRRPPGDRRHRWQRHRLHQHHDDLRRGEPAAARSARRAEPVHGGRTTTTGADRRPRPKVATVLQASGPRARARILVVGYIALLPDTGLGCWPVVPFAYGDVSYLRGIQKSLNAMLANAAPPTARPTSTCIRPRSDTTPAEQRHPVDRRACSRQLGGAVPPERGRRAGHGKRHSRRAACRGEIDSSRRCHFPDPLPGSVDVQLRGVPPMSR